MELQKRHFLIVLAIACLVLYYYGSQPIPYTKYLPLIGGGAYALNFIVNLAKQPELESVSATQSKQHDKSKY